MEQHQFKKPKGEKQQASSPSAPLPLNLPHELLQQQDMSNQETLRAKNNSRIKSIGNGVDLADLFAPPPLNNNNQPIAAPTGGEANKDLPPDLNSNKILPPPLPTQTPAMRTRSDSSAAGDHAHRRMPSTIRFDPSPTHQREVSWGLESNGDQSIVQPALQDAQVTSNLMRQFRRPNRGESGRISIVDLQNTRPMENEAEAYLIKALETRDFQSERKLSETGAVLTNVPRDDLDALELKTEGSLVTSAGQSNKDSSQPSRPENTAATHTGGEASALLRPPPVRRAAAKTRGHHRNETVGDKLESLAAAMDIVHIQHLDLLGDDLSNDNLPGPLQKKNEPIAGNTNSADTLQQNANLLFTRHRTATEDHKDEEMGEALLSPSQSDNSSVGTAASRRWQVLKNNLATSTKGSKGESPSKELRIVEGSESIEEEPAVISSSGDSSPPSDEEQHTSAPNKTKTKKSTSFNVRNSKNKFVTELEEFFSPRRKTISHFLRIVVFVIILPSMGVSALLFYLAGNPPTGVIDLEVSGSNGTLVNKNGHPVDPQTASASWWLLFLGVRQVLTFVLAKGVELFFIDFLSVRSRFAVKVVGPWVTLFILQTKGWPCLVTLWAIFNFALLSGTRPFFHHWGYWQHHVEWLNEANPSGQVVSSIWHHRLVAIALSMGIVVSAKRFWLGLYLGRQTFVQYSDKLAVVMKKILLISETASLGRAFERQVKHSEGAGKRSTVTAATFGLNKERFEGLINTMSDDSTTGVGTQSEIGVDTQRRVIDPDDRHPLTGSLSSSQKARISQLLGQWEEPTIVQGEASAQASVTELLQFRRALEYLNTSYPFSGSFGLADRRESTVESAQEVYDRLLLRSPDPLTLTFDVIALTGVKKDGGLDQEKLKEMIKLYRPDRDGALECIDFVKAVDVVYKELRLLRASVANSSKIDRAFESIFNVIFYAIMGCIILSQIGYDPLALFLSISGVILGFAFMIGSASSKYFEGLLFILVRRPFQIGDGISLSNIDEHSLEAGSPFWIVEDVDLFTTKVVYFKSSERATLNNGSLANSRVINATLSTQAKLSVTLKFPVSVSYEKLQVFHQALDQYFKNRPREWAAFLKFALRKIEADLGYVEYIIIGRHRLAWVCFAELLQSKADLMLFSMELSKKLDIWYRNPPLPVDLSIVGGGANVAELLNRPVEESQQRQVTFSPTSERAIDLKDLQTRFRPQT